MRRSSSTMARLCLQRSLGAAETSSRLPHCLIPYPPVMRVQTTTIAPIGLKLGRRVDLMLAAANNSASTDGFKFDTEAALEPRETRPVRIKPAAVLAAVKARPLGVRASGKLCVP